MPNTDKSKNYLSFNPETGYPVGENLFYECGACGGILPSMPKNSMFCSCRNIAIDIGYGRVAVKDNSKFKIFSKS